MNTIENTYQAGHLKATELFVFTENDVIEGAYYNGGSNHNKKLNVLVFRLWDLQMIGDFTIHLFHITGTQMIECGIDGLLRWEKSEGVSLGDDLLNVIPIQLSPCDRSPRLLSWIYSWWDDRYGPLHDVMKLKDCFTQTAEPGKIICGTFLWPLEQNWWSYCAIVSTGTLTQCTFVLYPDYALHDGESSC